MTLGHGGKDSYPSRIVGNPDFHDLPSAGLGRGASFPAPAEKWPVVYASSQPVESFARCGAGVEELSGGILPAGPSRIRNFVLR